MDIAKKYWTQIQAQLEGLPASTKLLIGSLVVILLLVGFIAVLYAGKPQMVPISQFASSKSDQVVAKLETEGLGPEMRNGQIYVPVNEQETAIAVLARAELIADDASLAFAVVTKSNPWETNQQGKRNYLIATQNYLNTVARKFKGIQSAEVVIAMPDRVGFGRSSVKPSASVTVTMEGSRSVDRGLVQSLAGLVSGAVAELRPQDVVILDANHGQQHTVADKDEIVPTEVVELVRQHESYHRKKIEDTLRHIQGVIVAVKVSTDPIRREVREERKYSESEPLRSEEDTEMTSKDFEDGGEGGVRPNTGMSIEGGASLAREQAETTSRREFGEKLLTNHAKIEMAGHQIEQINVTINVPRSYFVNIFKANNPEAEAPDDAALDAIKQQQLTEIKRQVTPLILAKAPGVIETAMVYDQAFLQPVVAGVGGDGGIVGTLTGNGMPATVAAVGLGLFSMFMLFMMVKRATKPQDLPTVQELAGIPPTLPSDDELIGEVEEFESSMSGVELDEGDLETRRLAEQISDMIKQSPSDAGNLLGKWVEFDD